MTEEQKKAFAKWLLWRGRQYILEMQEAKNKEAKEKEHARFFRRLAGDYSNDDDDDAEEDEETRIAQAWQLVKMEAETLTLDYIEIYGGEKFKSFIAQDISVLHQHYPRLLLDAQTTLDNENKRKEQKKRKLEDGESAGASAIDSRAADGSAADSRAADSRAAGGRTAGGSAGVNTGAPDGGSFPYSELGASTLIASLKRERSRLKKQIQDQSEVYTKALVIAKTRNEETKIEMWRARDACDRAESRNAELKAEIKKIKGERLDLPEDELRELLGDVTYAFRKISDTVHLGEVKTELERRNKFCCPISSELFINPVAGPDGYAYERKDIEEWIRRQLYSHQHTNLEGQWKSPSTPEYFTSTALPPAIVVKSLMSEEIEENLIKMRVKQVSR